MKNKKLLRAIASLTMAAAMVGSVFAYTGCNSGGGNDDPPAPPPTHTHSYSYTQNSDGKTHNGTCTSTVGTCDAPTITNENCEDKNSDGKCDKCKGQITQQGVSSDNAIVPAFTGEAAGPTAGTKNYDVKFKAETLATGNLASAYTDGVISMPAGTTVRDRKDSAVTGTKSVQNGKITIKMPAAGTIKIIFASGSSSVGSAKYKLTNPDNTSSTVQINAKDKATQTLEINDATAGTYIFEKEAGTVDVWEIDYTFSITATPIESIEITDEGLVDYLITQKVDCTGLKIIALDTNGAPYNVDLANCKFDVTKYNPDASNEYEIGVTYYLASNLDSSTKEFSKTYNVKVYAVDSISLETIGLGGSKQVTVQQAYLPNATFSKDYLTVIGSCKCGTETIDYKLKNEWVNVTAPDLTTAGEKEVGVSINTAYTVTNKAVNSSYKVIVKDKVNPEENKVEITVGATDCDFKTVTQAVQYLKACNYDSAVNKVIKVTPGTYTEKVWIDVDNVTLWGAGTQIDDTKITYSLVEGDVDKLSGSVWALNCATVHVTGANFKAYNIAIRNDFDYIANNKKYTGTQGPQGVALTLDTDGAVIYKCHLFGNQDTLYMKSGRSYYYQTQIDGNIDFIFGGDKSIAFFEECEIMAIDREDKEPAKNTDPQNGHVTAAKHQGTTKPTYGYVFYKCNLTDDGKVDPGAMSLGRPWGEKATVSYIECKFSAAYSQLGTDSGKKTSRWVNWDANIKAENADFSEYGSMDNSDSHQPIMQTAVKGGKLLTQEQADLYTKDNVFGNANSTAYTAAWNYENAVTTLEILVGIQSGALPQDQTVTINLKDENIPDGNCAEYLNTTYGDKFTWAGTASFQNGSVKKPENGVKVGLDTVITFNVVGEVSLVAGYELPSSDYIITYKDGKATVKFTATTGTYGDYIGSIIIDTSKTAEDLPDTATVEVTLDYNDGEPGTPDGTIEAVVGAPLPKPADPVRDGYKFAGWQKDGVDYTFTENVTEAFTLTAKWDVAEDFDFTQDVTVDFVADFNQTVQSSSLEWRGLTIDATTGKFASRKPGNQDIQVNSGTKLIFTIAEGKTQDNITIVIKDYTGADLTAEGNYTVEVVGTTVTITFTASSGVYIKSLSLTYND